MVPRALLTLLRQVLWKDRPIYAHYGLTHRCNLRCAMCTIREQTPGEELGLDRILILFKHLRDLGGRFLSVGGGEPLVREDLPEVLEGLAGLGYRVRLLSNGSLLDEARLAGLLRTGVRDFSISLDTLEPELYDRICGTRGMLPTVLANVSRLARAVRFEGGLVVLNCVLSRLNLREVGTLHDYAHSLGARISFLALEGRLADAWHFGPENRSELESTFHRLLSLKRRRGNALFNSSAYLRLLRLRLLGLHAPWPCHAGRFYVSVDPSGGIAPCHGLPLSAGWLSSGTHEFTPWRPVTSRPLCPGCLRPCWTEVSLAFSDPRSLLEAALLWRQHRTARGRA